MTFLELVIRFRELAGHPGTGPTAVTGQSGLYLRLVNQIQTAWNKIQAEHKGRWSFLYSRETESTVIDQNDYTLTSINHVREQNFMYHDPAASPVQRNGIGFMPYDEFTAAFPNYAEDDSGAPWVWTFTPDRKVRLYPKPDKVYTLTFDAFTNPVELAADSDEPAIRSDLHIMIVYRALIDMGGFEESMTTMEYASSEYARLFRDFTWEYKMDDPTEMVVRPV